MSSAILYIAIVAIWAFVLIPRWLRRPHLLGGEASEPVASANTDNTPESSEDQLSPAGSRPRPAYRADTESANESASVGQEPRRRVDANSRQVTPPRRGAGVLRARRRLLTVLLALTAAAGVCVYLKLTAWWACIPPGGMLGTYLLLLREAALADAEQARWRAAEAHRAQAARQVARFEPAESTALVIDISDRLGDQLYDQYADATIRAVGD
jgi:hypothetical protein